ncbi:MAG: nicotinamide-nucleotide amidase [Pseudomonadota bacterium]
MARVSDDELLQLAHTLGQKLHAKGWMLATAESCTGGWVAQVVTAIPGSSAWFDRGFVTYSNRAKEEMLGVSPATLDAHGAVSEETVNEMASGALTRSQAHISVAISGIAGPGGGTPKKPVGTVYIGWATLDGEPLSSTCHLSGDREEIRSRAVAAALRGLIELIE